jgi:hypothetical protein
MLTLLGASFLATALTEELIAGGDELSFFQAVAIW